LKPLSLSEFENYKVWLAQNPLLIAKLETEYDRKPPENITSKPQTPSGSKSPGFAYFSRGFPKKPQFSNASSCIQKKFENDFIPSKPELKTLTLNVRGLNCSKKFQ